MNNSWKPIVKNSIARLNSEETIFDGLEPWAEGDGLAGDTYNLKRNRNIKLSGQPTILYCSKTIILLILFMLSRNSDITEKSVAYEKK